MKFNKIWLIFIKISCFFHFFLSFFQFSFFSFLVIQAEWVGMRDTWTAPTASQYY